MRKRKKKTQELRGANVLKHRETKVTQDVPRSEVCTIRHSYCPTKTGNYVLAAKEWKKIAFPSLKR